MIDLIKHLHNVVSKSYGIPLRYFDTPDMKIIQNRDDVIDELLETKKPDEN